MRTPPRGVLRLVAGAVLGLGAVSATGVAQERARVPLLSGAVGSGAVRYDHASGRCSEGAEQLLEAAEIRRLSADWATPRAGRACTAPEKRTEAGEGDYPARFAALGIAGSAQVLVLLDADGSVAAVHPVCATGRPFAEAAADTTRELAFAPSRCDGTPVKAAFLLPFQYDAPPPPPQQLRTAGLQR